MPTYAAADRASCESAIRAHNGRDGVEGGFVFSDCYQSRQGSLAVESGLIIFSFTLGNTSPETSLLVQLRSMMEGG